MDAVAATRRAIPCAVAVVGPATGERARASGLAVAFAASHADSATLGRELPLPSGDVVLARSDLADGDLPMVLRERGSRVREIVAYRTVPAVSGDAHAVRDAIGAGRATIVVASPSAVTALRDALGAAELRTATFVAIGAPTARAVRETIGVHPIIAARTDARAVADAIPREPQEVTT